MDANQACDVLVSHLKLSNLNWNLVESPFSLTINLKKSFIKDREGNPRASGFSKHCDDQKVNKLEEENKSLRKALANEKHEKEEVIKDLESKAKEVENLRDCSLKVKRELSKISEELYNTKLELTQYHSEALATGSEVKRLTNAMVIERMQLNNFMKISETRSKETEKQIKTQDKLIETLKAENEMLKLEIESIQDNTNQEDYNHNSLETKSEPIYSSISNSEPLSSPTSTSFFNSKTLPSALPTSPPTTSSAEGQNNKKPDLKIAPDPDSKDENSNAAPNESSLVETKSCEEKDPVIEAKDNEITKDFLEECFEKIKARIGT